MILRRVFGDFDVRAIRELLVPGQGVAIRAGAPRRLKFFIRFTQRTAQICRCEWQGKEISPPITRVISHWIEVRWRLRRDAGHCAATTDERERPRSAVVEGVSVRLLLSVEIAEQDCFWSSIDSFACSITIEATFWYAVLRAHLYFARQIQQCLSRQDLYIQALRSDDLTMVSRRHCRGFSWFGFCFSVFLCPDRSSVASSYLHFVRSSSFPWPAHRHTGTHIHTYKRACTHARTHTYTHNDIFQSNSFSFIIYRS